MNGNVFRNTAINLQQIAEAATESYWEGIAQKDYFKYHNSGYGGGGGLNGTSYIPTQDEDGAMSVGISAGYVAR
jgi:hypothetical protein